MSIFGKRPWMTPGIGDGMQQAGMVPQYGQIPEVGLGPDEFAGQRHACRTAIDDRAHGRPVTLAEGGDTEE